MAVLRARFDGRVVIPHGPVDLARQRLLEVQVREMDEPPAARQATADGRFGELPFFGVPDGAKLITTADVSRGEDEP